MTTGELIVVLVLLALLAEAAYRNVRTGLIFDAITLPGIVIGLALNAVLLHRFWPCAAGAAVGFAVPFVISEIYFRLRRVKGLGFGVIKESAMIGAFLGVVGICVCLAVAFVSGVIYAVLRKPRKRSVQFAPFLLIGVLVYVALVALRVL